LSARQSCDFQSHNCTPNFSNPKGTDRVHVEDRNAKCSFTFFRSVKALSMNMELPPRPITSCFPHPTKGANFSEQAGCNLAFASV